MTAQVYMLTAGGDEVRKICNAGYNIVMFEGKKYVGIAKLKTMKGKQAKKILDAMPWRE